MAAVFQRFLQIDTRHSQARNDAEEDRGNASDEECPGERAGVDARAAQQGKRNGSLVGKVKDDGVGNRQAKGRSHGSEYQALGEQLTDQSETPRSQSTPHGKLLAARGGASQQQVGEIRAGDQQNEPDSTPQHDEGTAQLSADMLLEAGDLYREVASVPIGMRGHHLWVDDVGFGLRLRYCDARLQQANHRQHVSPGADVIHDYGGKNIRFYPGMKDTAEVEAGGQHADDGYGAIVERNRLTHNRRIAGELPLPEGMAQQNRWPAAFDGLLGE